MMRVLTLALLLAPNAAWGSSVFLNGTNIDAVRNTTFKDCSVRIDEAGNIFITAKGYEVKQKAQTAPPTAAVGGPPTRRYWLVTEKAVPGKTQYDIDLFVNQKWVRKFLSQEQHVVMEITKHLRTGKNKLHFVAKKHIGASRLSSSPQHYFRIVVGEGDSGGRNVMINKKLVDYKRTAMETKDHQDEFVIEVR